MADETRGRKPKAINDLIDSKIMEFRDQIVLEKNKTFNLYLILNYLKYIKVQKYLGKTNIEQFEYKLLNPAVLTKDLPSFFDFWDNIKQNICIENFNTMDIDNMIIEFAYDNDCQLNENNQSLTNSMTDHEDVIPLGIINSGAKLANTNFEEIGLINTAVEGVTNNFYETIENKYNVAVEEITKTYNETMETENAQIKKLYTQYSKDYLI